VIDQALAERLRVDDGAFISVLGRRLLVSGKVKGTASITGSFAFVTRLTAEQMLNAPNVVSYLLVRAAAGTDATPLAARINDSVDGVTASSRTSFAASERRVVGDMSTDIVRSMILVGFVVGVAVAGLTAYSQILAQQRDYGVLRALGLSARRALAHVVAQVGALVLAGFVAALALVLLLAAALPALSPTLVLSVRAPDVAEAALVAAAVAVVASLIPVIRVVRVDPASVFRSFR
jgi:putative ABC transport system permease protein